MGGESIHISICKMCQTPILFAQCNNSSAKTSRGGIKIYLVKKRTDFFFFKLFKELSGFNCLNGIAEEYFRGGKKFFTELYREAGEKSINLHNL